MKTRTLSNVLAKITPPASELAGLAKTLLVFGTRAAPSLRKLGAKLFIGGSLAKQTLIKRDRDYDIDIFVLFPYEKYRGKSGKISELLEKVLKDSKLKYDVLKGSRNYYQCKFNSAVLEIIPILEIKSAKDALNITDISPLHVDYILGQIKKKRGLNDEIRLAKAFCYAQDCYGAESYIRGFSGYALELLASHYGSFMNLAKAAAKWDAKKKIIIDPAKHYKKISMVLDELNEAKITSPLILVDPVQKERNACASLSLEVLNKFIKASKAFVKNPDERFFFKAKLDVDKLKSEAKKSHSKLVTLRAVSAKDKIDVAGAKLKKFYDFLLFMLKKNGFSVSKSEFVLDYKTLEADFYLILKEPEKNYIVNGPPLNVDKKYAEAFRKKWPKSFEKKGRLFAKAKREISSVEQMVKAIAKPQLREMGIKSISISK